MQPARVQGLAGIHIVGGLSLDEQDRIAGEIAHRFPADPRFPRIIARAGSDPRQQVEHMTEAFWAGIVALVREARTSRSWSSAAARARS